MYTEIATNQRRTVILIGCFILLIAALGWVFSQASGQPGLLIFALIFAVIYAVAGYFWADRVVLGLSAAKPIAKADAPDLYRLVENLAITAGLPTPQIYIIESAAANAFATGRDPEHASVAVTTGILQRLDKPELEGVIAHELSHVGNRDIRLMALVVVLVSLVSVLSHWFLRFSFWGGGRRDSNDGEAGVVFAVVGIVLAIIAPIIGFLVQLAVSRRREYLADASGALLTRYPEGLASALEKIAADPAPLDSASTATAHLYIANPLKSQRGQWLAGLFDTHPPIQDRINRLRGMETKE